MSPNSESHNYWHIFDWCVVCMLLPEHEAVIQQNQAASYMNQASDICLMSCCDKLGSNAHDAFRVRGTSFLRTAAVCMQDEWKPACLSVLTFLVKLCTI